MWIGDDFHHNGAFRLSYGFEYAAMMETSKENEHFAFDRYDTYDWYLKLGPALERQREVPAREDPDAGTTSSRTRTTTPSGRGRPCRRTSRA